MHADEIYASLHPLEVKVLLALGERDHATDRELIQEEVTTKDHIRTVIEWQRHKGGLEVTDQEELEFAELTPAGRHHLEHGVPELVLLERLRAAGGELAMAELRQAPGINQEEAGSAVGALRKAGLLEPLEGGRVRLAEGDTTPFQLHREAVLRLAEQGRTPMPELPEELQSVIRAGSRKRGKARGIFRLVRELTRTLRLTETGQEVARRIQEAGLTGEEVNVLTPEMLRDGSWERRTFRRYNIDIAPPRQVTGKRNPYRSFLGEVQGKLLSMGFEEMAGPLVETEFWNLDALFLPQFHPAES